MSNAAPETDAGASTDLDAILATLAEKATAARAKDPVAAEFVLVTMLSDNKTAREIAGSAETTCATLREKIGASVRLRFNPYRGPSGAFQILVSHADAAAYLARGATR